MKNLLTRIAAACILVLLIQPVCAQQHTLIGTWRVNVIQSIQEMGNLRNEYDSLPAETKQKINESMEDRSFVFQSDGKIKITWKARGVTKESEGVWQTDETGSRVLINVMEDIKHFNILWRNEFTMVLKNPVTTGFFSNLVLVKP